MEIDLSQWSLRFLCNVHHYTDCISHPEPVLAMLDAIMRAFEEFRFDSKVTANPLGRFRLRQFQPNPRNWTKARAELQSGQISTLAFGSLTADRHDLQIDVAFQLFHAPQRSRWPNSEGATDSMSISIAASVLHSGTLATCQRILRQAWEEFGAAYAYADMFASHQTGLVSPWVGPIAARTLRAHLWTSKTESPGIDLKTYVPDAYWLSFLNAQHIQQLGGIEELKAKLPRNATVAPVAYNGYAITLSQSPLYDNFEDWEADHGALCRVLEPIIRSR